ncbi:hypothetical protein KXV70_001089 [Aspergillus fumigatus]|uniref:C2H2 finger domain-containing protein n=1 Tax=Aspergillus fumigatus TaxID=746128 RepID=A0A9P8N8V9_ASPFM|nr:hypothetical protein KXX49_008138 [Aspergillus fumigatus]KAH1414970.1 hypothetical protein KXX64_007075 [Aspergillus fumigatus]KAH1451899.1 hypothetical protein KXX58_003662 [Aspergillus fumigatus]KAH1567502.1 hypothetical protein KXX17_002221 [Aspergillus fumigatus]KAH1613563.1 hypothetical protein KXX31_004533 [Aspergillus fumigatus]
MGRRSRPARSTKQPSEGGSDSSGESFRLSSGESETDSSSVLTDVTVPDSPKPAAVHGGRSLPRAQNKARPSQAQVDLPDFSDDPDDDTDEDLADVPLDYGRGLKTKQRGDRIEKRWHKYCRVKAAEPNSLQKWNDPSDALRQITPNDVHRFFNYCGKLQYGIDGRRLKGLKKASALYAEWKSFQGYYRRITRQSISDDYCEEINAGLRRLIDKWELDTDEREKTPVYVQDLTEFNETTLRTQEKRFHVGFERIQICLFTMLGIYTVNRLQALLSLQFKHLQFSIQRDPLGGPPIPLVEIRSKYVKKFLGISQHNNFPLPEIIDDPSLIFSPHVFLFGILFWLDAFEAPNLRSMEDLRKLLVEGGRQQLELPLKSDVAEHYIFCMTRLVKGEVDIQWTEPMNESTMSGRLKSLGEIHGWLHSFFAHRFRYGGGKMLNKSGAVSEAEQNLIMKHANIRTFLNHYLPRHIDADMQNIMNGRDSNTTLMRAITRISRWIDKRRPRKLTDQQRASIREHPEYLAAVSQRDQQEKAYQENPSSQMLSKLQRLRRKVLSTYNRLYEALRKRTREEFDRKQAVIDIERQLSGTALNDEEAKEVLRTEDEMPPERIHLIEKLFSWPTSPSLEGEWARRNAATMAVSQYCPVREGGPLRGRPKRKAPSDTFDDEQRSSGKRNSDECCQPSKRPSARELLFQEAEEHIRTAKKPRRCFQCFGNSSLPDNRRTQEWTQYKSTLRHFRSKHLDDRKCNFCGDTSEDFLHEMHLRNHAATVHRLIT